MKIERERKRGGRAKMEGKGELEVSEAKLLYCVTVGERGGKGKEEFA